MRRELKAKRMRNKRVISIVLNDFTSDSRVLKINKSLAKNGYRTTVLATHRDGLPIREHIDGFDVIRIRLVSAKWPRGVFWGILKFTEFSLRSFWLMRKSDIVHCNDFEPLPIAVASKLLTRRKKIVYDCHEYEAHRNGLSKRLSRVVAFLERRLIPFADFVITVSEGIAEEYKKMYGLDEVGLIYNTPYLSEPKNDNYFRDTFQIPPEKKIFLFHGGLFKGRGIALLIEAFKTLESENCVIVFMGYGALSEEIKSLAEQQANFYYHPKVAYRDLVDVISSADYGIVSIENSCLSYYYCMPNKLFECIHARLPVVLSDLHELRKMAEREHIGEVIRPYNAQGIRDAVLKMMGTPKASYLNHYDALIEQYNWQEQEKKLLAYFDHLI